MIKRREFIAGLGSAAAWPIVVRAQQSERVRRVGVLTSYEENDAEAKTLLSALTEGLTELGWIEGRNLRMEFRWTRGVPDRALAQAKELVDLQPDVIVAESTPQTAALQRETRTIPIIFLQVSDPIGSGFIASLSRPGANITGLAWMEPSIGGKWVELLAEIVPGMKRVAGVFNPDTAPYVPSYYLPSFEAAARSLKIDPIVSRVHSEAEIEMLMASLAGEQRGGLVAMSDGYIMVHRVPIVALAARYKVPAIYFNASIVRDGGLLSYAADSRDIFHRAASYVDRILRGQKPAELPVQLPVKFQMALNTRTANTLGLTVPQSIVLRADEVTE
jgi:putative ABC transport system substrate-binding protein